MPTFMLTSPEGKQYKVNAPEGATVEQAFEYLKQSEPSAFEPKGKTVTGIKPELGDLSGMPRPRRVQRVPSSMALKEVTEAAGGPAEFYGQNLKAFGREGTKAALGAPGDILAALNTINPGRLLGIVPDMPEQRGMPTSEDIGKTFNFKQTPAEYQGAGFLGTVAGPAAIGKVVGGVTQGVTAARNALSRLSNAKFTDYLRAAEGKGTDIINYLQNAQELVPGSQPTVAQALAAAPEGGAAYTRFAGLQPRGQNIPDELLSAYNQRAMQQRGARETSLGQVAGTPISQQMTEGQRLAKTEPMFEAARENKVPVDIGSTLDKIDTLIADNPGNPELLAEMNRIRKGLVIPETPATPELARTKAKEIASSLDGIKTAIADEKNKFIKRELTDIKDSIVEALPGMKEAQTTFAQMSKPINEMNIGTYLRDALTGPVEAGAERATSFAAKVKNAPQTVRLTTGQTARTLEDAGVSKQSIDKINGVMEDLNRSLAAEKLQAAAGSTVSKDPSVKRVNILSRVATAFNEVVGELTARIGSKKALQIATEMLDPKVAADVLKQAMAMEKTQAARSVAAANVSPTIRNIGIGAVPINALAPPSQNNLAGR